MRKLTIHKHMREINGHKRNSRKFFNFRKYSKIMLQLSYNVYVNTINFTNTIFVYVLYKLQFQKTCSLKSSIDGMHIASMNRKENVSPVYTNYNCIKNNKITMYSTIIMTGLLPQFFQYCFAFKKPSFSSA